MAGLVPQLRLSGAVVAAPRTQGRPGEEEARLQRMVDDFLLSLPLGTSAQDAAVEDKVAECLLQLYRERQTLEGKLSQW
jgi:hypothetical protein